MMPRPSSALPGEAGDLYCDPVFPLPADHTGMQDSDAGPHMVMNPGAFYFCSVSSEKYSFTHCRS